MKLAILMNDSSEPRTTDGCVGLCDGIVNEHGLSVYAETPHHHVLVDTGQSSQTWANAEALGVAIDSVDTVVLSHGHYDHTGGVMSFAERNPRATILINELAGRSYWNMQKDRYIGIDPEILSLPQTRMLPGSEVTEVGEEGEILIFGGVTGRRLWPQGNRILTRKTDDGFVQDVFDHEQYVVLRESGRSVLIGGCAHVGVLNILDRYRELFGGCPDAMVSGFHMMKQGEYTEDEIATIRETAEELRGYPVRFYTGHCTSVPAYEIMKPILGEKIAYFGCGEMIDV